MVGRYLSLLASVLHLINGLNESLVLFRSQVDRIFEVVWPKVHDNFGIPRTHPYHRKQSALQSLEYVL